MSTWMCYPNQQFSSKSLLIEFVDLANSSHINHTPITKEQFLLLILVDFMFYGFMFLDAGLQTSKDSFASALHHTLGTLELQIYATMSLYIVYIVYIVSGI